MGALFDVATLDPGSHRRFAEDQYAPFRIVVHRWIPVWRGPCMGGDELTILLGRMLEHYGATVHATRDELELPEGNRWPDGHYAVVDCSLLATSHAHANEIFADLADRALSELEDDWEWFEHNNARDYRPGGAA